MARRHAKPLKRRAISALARAARQRFGPNADVGRLTWLGEGLARKAWYAVIEAPDGSEHAWVAQVPRADTEQEALDRFARELSLLTRLADLELPFRTPRPVAAVEVDGIPVNVTTVCGGMEVDMRGRRTKPSYGARIIGEVAAAIHSLSCDGWPLPGRVHATRRSDAVSALHRLQEVDAPFVDEVLAWCTEHLPDAGEPCFVHGDLLGQNVLWELDGSPAVVDWEYAGTGDPAGDLAVVTRGRRRVFGVPEGRAMLLDAYNAAAVRAISPTALRVRELTLVAGLVAAFVRQYPHTSDAQFGRLRNLYQRPLET